MCYFAQNFSICFLEILRAHWELEKNKKCGEVWRKLPVSMYVIFCYGNIPKLRNYEIRTVSVHMGPKGSSLKTIQNDLINDSWCMELKDTFSQCGTNRVCLIKLFFSRLDLSHRNIFLVPIKFGFLPLLYLRIAREEWLWFKQCWVGGGGGGGAYYGLYQRYMCDSKGYVVFWQFWAEIG